MSEHLTEVVLGDQATIRGQAAIVDVVKANYDRIVVAEIDDILKSQLQVLAVAVGRLSETLPRSDGRRAAYSFESLVDEILARPLKGYVWEISCDFLRKAAGRQGEADQAVHASLDQLSPLLIRLFGPYGLVELREITVETVRTICALSDTLADPKKGFVAPNAISITQAHFTPSAWFRAIYAGDVPVGFIMIDDKPAEARYFLWRFMIAEPYHGRGYGRQAIERLLEHVRTRLGAKELLVSCGQGEGSPEGFYRWLGFEPTGEKLGDGDEIVLRRPL